MPAAWCPVTTHANLYDILGVRAIASVDEVKSAFRKSALKYHPDRNNNSFESAARFRIIYNAYSVLSDPARRREYDSYLRTSSVFGGPGDSPADPHSTRHRRRIDATSTTLLALLDHINYILWDIEELVRTQCDWNRRFDGLPVRDYVLRMLRFIDTWILEKTGFPDYFFRARRIEKPTNPEIYSEGKESGHRPFVNLQDYFYNIRLRTDKFLKNVKLSDLLEPVPGTEIRIIDCVLEAHNHSVHYLGYLRRAVTGEIETIPPFHHSNRCFCG